MDAEEFADQAVELHDRLTRVAYLVGGDRELAEECAQEALVRAWQRVDRGEAIDSLVAWCTTVALNICRSQLRRRRAEVRAIDRLPAERGLADVSTRMLSADVHQAVLVLPLRQREVVVLHYFADRDVAGTAEVLGISVGAVKNALFHARASLARALGTGHDEAANQEQEQR